MAVNEAAIFAIMDMPLDAGIKFLDAVDVKRRCRSPKVDMVFETSDASLEPSGCAARVLCRRTGHGQSALFITQTYDAACVTNARFSNGGRQLKTPNQVPLDMRNSVLSSRSCWTAN